MSPSEDLPTSALKFPYIIYFLYLFLYIFFITDFICFYQCSYRHIFIKVLSFWCWASRNKRTGAGGRRSSQQYRDHGFYYEWREAGQRLL